MSYLSHAENIFDNPENVVPVKSVYQVEKIFEYATPATSLTVIRIKTKK
jgi:alpha-L-arabinofuranosidase